MVLAFIYFPQYDLYVEIYHTIFTRKNTLNSFSDYFFVKAIERTFVDFSFGDTLTSVPRKCLPNETDESLTAPQNENTIKSPTAFAFSTGKLLVKAKFDWLIGLDLA